MYKYNFVFNTLFFYKEIEEKLYCEKYTLPDPLAEPVSPSFVIPRRPSLITKPESITYRTYI
jgi:hypothetical protein